MCEFAGRLNGAPFHSLSDNRIVCKCECAHVCGYACRSVIGALRRRDLGAPHAWLPASQLSLVHKRILCFCVPPCELSRPWSRQKRHVRTSEGHVTSAINAWSTNARDVWKLKSKIKRDRISQEPRIREIRITRKKRISMIQKMPRGTFTRIYDSDQDSNQDSTAFISFLRITSLSSKGLGQKSHVWCKIFFSVKY